ncbi:MAG: DUF5675 family protein [Mucispirillum sp.]|nr:DUF5675 family protein [Mucispirillum sp.]
MKKLTLKRVDKNDECIFGALFLEEKELCKTLELPWRDNQKGISCIPAGEYKLSPYPSSRFGEVYIVNDVPNRTGILIHTGNTASDIEGCILVGDSYGKLNGKKAVLNSRQAFNLLKETLGEEEYLLNVVDTQVRSK